MINRVLRAGQRILSRLQSGDSSIFEIDAELVAFGPSRLPDDEKMTIRRTVWTPQFLELVTQYIKDKKENWKILYVAIGNTTAFAVLDVIERVLECSSLLDLLFQHLNISPITHTTVDESQFHNPLEIALAHLEQENDEKTIATWIIANLVQAMDGEISEKIYRFIPPLSQIITIFLNGPSIKVAHSLSEEELTALFSDKQTEFRSFRALTGLFSIRMTRLSFPKEYNDFIQEILQYPFFIRSVLYEYSLGLDGIVIPGTQFYPDAYQRALTISFLTKIPECQRVLLENSCVVSLLTQSLWTRYLDSDLQTSLLWKRSLNSLYNLTFSCRDRHTLFRQDENIDVLLWIAGWSQSKSQLISRKDRQIAAEIGSILHIKEIWEIERLFWITQRKKQKNCCFLSLLPEAFIRIIMKWLIFLSPSDEHPGRIREIYNGYNRSSRK